MAAVNVSYSPLAMQPQYIVALKVIVGVTCVFSVFGASLIILTYVLFKDLRTTARQLLVNLSVADIFVAGSHFVGLFTNFDRFVHQVNPAFDTLCTVQAAITMCGTLASFLWTVAIGLYMFMVIVRRQPHLAKKLVYAFYPFCWGVPMVVTIIFGANKLLGFEQATDVGWCYIRFFPNANLSNSTDRSKTILTAVFGYEIWVYATIISLLLLYVTTHCHVQRKMLKAHSRSTSSIQTGTVLADLKLIFVPLIFLLLRMWSVITDVSAFYLADSKREEFSNTNAAAIILLLAGVGNSAQGLANAILFCMFTKQVRQKLLRTVSCLLCSSCCTNNTAYLLHMSANDTHEETTTFASYDVPSSDHTSNAHYMEDPANPLMDVSGDSYDFTCTVSEDRSYGTILCRNEGLEKLKHPS